MENRGSFLIDKSSKFKTKPLWIFLSILIFIVIPFVNIWLLLGEFNLLNQNNVVAINQTLWQGKVTSENIQSLLVYEPFVRVEETKTFEMMINEWLNKNMQIIANFANFNWIVLVPILILIVISLIYPFIFRLFHLFAYDILPFSISFSCGFSILFISGMWPHFPQQDMFLVYWLLRIIVFLASIVIVFFIINFIVNKILSHGTNNVSIALNYFEQTKNNNKLAMKNS